MRDNRISYLRAIAAMAIVILHTFQYEAEGFAVMGTDKIISMVIRNLTLWAVPCFVMVSGALLLNPKKDITYRRLFIRYILKIVLTLFVFVIIYGITDVILGVETFSAGLVVTWLQAFYSAAGWKPLWYMYMLIAIYLMIPIYKKVAAGCTPTDIRYLLVILFIFQSIVPFVERITGTDFGFYICVYTVYTLYFFLGYAIYHRIINIPRTVSVTIMILSLIADVVLTLLAFKIHNKVLYELLGNYSFFLTVIQALGVFSLAVLYKNGASHILNKDRSEAHSKENPGFVGRILLKIDRVSLEIYLISLIFIRIIVYGLKWNPYTYGLWMTMIHAVIVFVCSYAVSWVIYSVKSIINKRRK